MEERRDTPPKDDREARLKAALKSNIARRKAQARARAASGRDAPGKDGTERRDDGKG